MGTIAQKAPESEEAQINRDSTTRSLFYNVNAASQLDAENSLFYQSPVTYQGLYKIGVKATAKLPGELWDGEVQYGWPKRNPEVGTCWVEFDTTGGKKKLMTSLGTQSSYVSPTAQYVVAPDFGGAIGVSQNNVVEGVDVPSPSLKFSIHLIMDRSDVTMDFLQGMAAISGYMNETPIWSFDTHELLFHGCTGSTKLESISQPGVEMIFQMEGSASSDDITVGSGANAIENISKDGWDYLWELSKKAVDPDASDLVTRPVAAYVERVLYEIDFNEAFGFIPDISGGQSYSGPQYAE